MVIDAGVFPIGKIGLLIEKGALEGLCFDAGPFGSPDGLTAEDRAVYETALNWLNNYFSGSVGPVEGIELRLRGSCFQLRVWEELSKIAPGKCVSYGEIARTLEKRCGKRVSAQAVGGAVGRNPLPILLPCHRVIGYSCGIEKKIWLLRHEGFTVENGKVVGNQ